MKNKLFQILSIVFPILSSTVEFDSNAHFQLCTQWPIETSYLKFTGNFYDTFDDGPHMWILSPKVYLNGANPPSFGCSAGTKHPLGSVFIGHHSFLHSHNWGDFVVNQFGHSAELIHPKWEARLNYYYPAFSARLSTAKVTSSHRLESEVLIKLKKLYFGGGPIYQIDPNGWGFGTKVAFNFDSVDLGVEIIKPPTDRHYLPIIEEYRYQYYPVQASVFAIFKFPVQKISSLSSTSDNSTHYSNLQLEVPLKVERKNDN